MTKMSYAPRVALGLAVVSLGIWIAPFSLLGTINLAMVYGLIAISLVVLTGWVGQISLSQASFVGLGAFVTGVFVRNAGIPFPLTLPLAAAATAAVATLLGVVAVRVRGLYLAVATLIFAWIAQEYLFNQAWLAGAGGSSTARSRPLGVVGAVPRFDLTDRHTFYYILLAAVITAAVGASNLRDSKTGRAWFAVKGSEIAAASLGISVIRYKLLAFAVSGFLAGLAGSLVMTHSQVATATSFAPTVSLFYLSIAVVGGLDSIAGALASALLFALLEELFYRVAALAGFLLIVSAGLLAIVLLFFPAGLAGVAPRARRYSSRTTARLMKALAPFRRSATKRPQTPEQDPPLNTPSKHADDAKPRHLERAVKRLRGVLPRHTQDRHSRHDALEQVVALPVDLALAVAEIAAPVADVTLKKYVRGAIIKPTLPDRQDRRPVLVAENVTVRFGGLTALDGADLTVNEGEIVGLIGPNGAGKTTLFNAISGLNDPVSGSVTLFGEDITRLPVQARADRGMARTFQIIQLFPQLTVFDNLLVGTHSRNRSTFLGHLCASQAAMDGERTARIRVRAVLEMLDLQEVADRRVAVLPFGVLRMVELARAIVTGAPFVMLDEPASGLDNRETDEFSERLQWLRAELGLAILLIEHDVRLVTSLTDYIYVLDRGVPIAEGTPEDVQRNPAVVAAYLGEPTDSQPLATDSSDMPDERASGKRRPLTTKNAR
jgi:ABC-type branched-subunit amino acid transport system ATPase component/ABC-type branched-subunit amino acid transport system permease subunit